MLLPEGTTIPPLPHLAVLVAGAVAVGYGFRERRPVVRESRVVALTPWMLLGATLYALSQVGAIPGVLAPFAGSPAVYVTVAVVAGGVWLLAEAAGQSVARTLTATGTAALVGALAVALGDSLARGSLSITWPAVAFVVSIVVGALGWFALVRLRPAVSVTGRVGALALVGHAVDGVSTAVGIDVLGFGERTPLSRLVIEFAASLPTADVIGAGWLFVVVKLVVAGAVVTLLASYVRDEPQEGYPLLALVAAVGLGPGAHNLVLFTIA